MKYFKKSQMHVIPKKIIGEALLFLFFKEAA
jgi:hypothetical protein